MTPRSAFASIAAMLLLASCSSTGTATLDPRTWFGSNKSEPKPVTRESPGVEARLKAIGTSINGTVRVRESGDLLVVRAELVNAMPGTSYRLVFHSNGNCSSPNGFSAGPPWSPPGAKEPPGRLVPEVYVNSEGNGILTARLRGVGMGGDAGLLNRSVLVYQGSFVETPKPDVANNVVACGAFVRATALF